jgi:hypothetical protein
MKSSRLSCRNRQSENLKPVEKLFLPLKRPRAFRYSSSISGECKIELMRRKGLQNPITLNAGLNRAVEKLLKLNREKASMKQPPVRRRIRPKRSDFGRVLGLRNRPLFGWINFEPTIQIDESRLNLVYYFHE